MNWAIFIAGFSAVVITLVAQGYLRVRGRQLRMAAHSIADFREISVDLMHRNMPDDAKQQIVDMASLVGSGRLAKRITLSIVKGKLDTPVRRATVASRRLLWADYSRETRILFTQAIFAGLLADSYYAGFVGTIMRRTLFFLKESPAEIALSMDAYETKILIVGTEELSKPDVKSRKGKGHLVGA